MSAILVDVYEQIERVIDLTDPALNHLYGMNCGRGAGVGARWASGEREPDSRLLCIAGQARSHRQNGTLARPAASILSGQAQRRPSAHRLRSHRQYLRLAQKAKGYTVSFGPIIRAWCRRIMWLNCNWWAVLTPTLCIERFFTPATGTLPADLDVIGRAYISALADEIAQWLHSHSER